MSAGVHRMRERIVETAIRVCGLASILIVATIFIFLVKEGSQLFGHVSLGKFLGGIFWYPISSPAQFGILPLILGSLLVTLGATLISIPFGVAAAIFISEIAPKRFKEILKSGVELLAAIPSVVLGFIGMITVVPWVKAIFGVPTGLSALSGSILLAFMAMPTIVSIAEDALHSVPRIYKEGAYALGATKWQTIWRVVLPAASSGILAAVMLGVGRVVGETMAVMMVTGNAAAIPKSFFSPTRTLTATIAAEMGEVVQGSDHYFALFSIGIVLFLITFLINMTADLYLHRKRK